MFLHVLRFPHVGMFLHVLRFHMSGNIPTCGKSLITSSLKVIASTPSHRLEPNSHVYMGSYILFLYVKSSFSCIFQSVH
jgi:hypothetical protein